MTGEEYRSVFAKKLNYYMDINKKSQVDLINELGFNRSSVSSWCVGTRVPRPEVIDTLAKYFNVRRSDLLEYKKEGDIQSNEVSKEGQKLLEAYNNRSKLKILFDKQINLSDEIAQVFIDLVDKMSDSDN